MNSEMTFFDSHIIDLSEIQTSIDSFSPLMVVVLSNSSNQKSLAEIWFGLAEIENDFFRIEVEMQKNIFSVDHSRLTLDIAS